MHGKFEHVSGLKSKLVADHEDKFPPVGDLECEYFHKGSKRWIENDQDLEPMYNLFMANDEITIWCEGKLPTVQSARGCKRKAEEQELPTKTKPDKFDELAHELYEKHGESYSMPQFRLWARMYLNKQYKSLDKAPPYPPFQEKAPKMRKQESSLSEALTSATTAVVGLLHGEPSAVNTTVSPGKRARVAGQYLEHLEKLKSLHEAKILSDEEFDEQKSLLWTIYVKLNSQ